MIPTYHCAAYLRAALESVLAQDPGPVRMQIEVVDDHSTADDPEAVVRELAGDRVAFHRQSRNVGHAANFNTCLRRSRGELVHLLHGDDEVEPGFYATMARPFAEDPRVGAAFCRYVGIDEHSRRQSVSPLEAPHPGRVPHWLERIALGQRLQVVCMVVRRDAYERVGGFAAWPFAEDWEMWVRLAAHVPVWYEPQPLARYRVHAASMTNDYLRTAENARQLRLIMAANERYFPPATARRITRRAIRINALTAVRRARRFLDHGDRAGMWAQLREAVTSDPSPVVVGRAFAVVARLLLRPSMRRIRAWRSA
jgi:glycosyltransferase involved in cell wall biosynthesis